MRLSASGSTVYRTKRRFVLGNLKAALSEEPRPGVPRKLRGDVVDNLWKLIRDGRIEGSP